MAGKKSDVSKEQPTKLGKRTKTVEHEDESNKKKSKSAPKNSKPNELLPVSLLCGFLGAGKTTLLKHILETQHSKSRKFKCAVIVNDMAGLNIDKSLIDTSALVQSDEVIAMQNGCVCCTLKSDLVDQIVELVSTHKFNYMIIEASGVSEPSEIARLFSECKDEQDRTKHEKQTLNEVARLDTCVTVVDAAEFLKTMQAADVVKKTKTPKQGSFAQLMAEQVEYSNAIVLNKTDLVDAKQLSAISEHISVLNPRAKLLTARNSRINVMEVVNTQRFNAEDFNLTPFEAALEEKEPECCVKSRAKGESPCCKRARTIDSGKSQVLLASKQTRGARHTVRFGISSFLYRARRPFHPQRFHELFVEKYFMFVSRDEIEDEDGDSEEEEEEEEEEGEEEEEEIKSAGKKKKSKGEEDDGEAAALRQQLEEMQAKHAVLKAKYSEAKQKLKQEDDDEEEEEGEEGEEEEGGEEEKSLEERQLEAKEKEAVRTAEFGTLLRSKGFIWMANTHDLTGCVSQAGNVVTIESPGTWSVLDPAAYKGTEEEKATLRREWQGAFGDRRQELVFIGQELKHEAVQGVLDTCLLTDDEMALGVDGWKATYGDIVLDS